MSSTSAGRSNTSLRHSRVVSSRIGNDGYLAATDSRSAARWRCCHSGVRWSGRRRGSSNALAAHSLNRDANIEVSGRRPTTRSRTSSGSNIRSSTGSSSAASGRRITMPSSPHIRSTSTPQTSRRRACSATPQGACTCAPNGVSTHTRQSPISSRNRSTTTVRVVGNGAGGPRPGPQGNSEGCQRPSRRGRSAGAAGPQPCRRRPSAAPAPGFRRPGPARWAGPVRRRARTASCPARRARGSPPPARR